MARWTTSALQGSPVERPTPTVVQTKLDEFVENLWGHDTKPSLFIMLRTKSNIMMDGFEFKVRALLDGGEVFFFYENAWRLMRMELELVNLALDLPLPMMATPILCAMVCQFDTRKG